MASQRGMAGRSAASAERLALIVTGLGAFASALYRVRTHDTFFHLATGRAIAELGAVPKVDPFSFTVRGAPWTNHSAGFQRLIYAVYQSLGFVGISLWQAATALALFAIGVASVRREQRVYACALGLLPFVFYREVLEARPHVLGFVCLALTLWLARDAPRALSWPKALLWFATYALFCSAHGSHLLALFVTGCAMSFALAQRDLRAASRWALLLVACLALVLWLQPEAFAQGSQHLSSEFLESRVAEWRPLTPSDLVSMDKGIVFLACFALTLMGAVAALHEPGDPPPSRFGLTLAAALMLLALSSWRMVALFLFAAAPLWLPLACRALALFSEKLRVEVRYTIWLAGVGALLAHLLWAEQPYILGAGLEQTRFPSSAVARLRMPDAPRRVYNAYNFGAYLIWSRTPSAGVFVDGRAITVYPAEFLAAFERGYDDPRAFEQLSARFAVDGVLMPVASPRVQRLLQYLAKEPRWRELYRDPIAVLYSRR